MEHEVWASATGAHSASQPVQGLDFVSIGRGKAEERVWGGSLGSGGLRQVRKSRDRSEDGKRGARAPQGQIEPFTQRMV